MSLFEGRFASPPAMRLYGTVGDVREATEKETSLWYRRVRTVRSSKGYSMMWENMKMVRDITFSQVEPVHMGQMTRAIGADVFGSSERFYNRTHRHSHRGGAVPRHLNVPQNESGTCLLYRGKSTAKILSKDNNGRIPHSMAQEGKGKPLAAGSRRALVQKNRAGSRLRCLVGLGAAGPVSAPVVGRVPVGIR